jgi:hypothetical protein
MEIQSATSNDNNMSRNTHVSTMVTGLFRDRESAERAYQAVTERGYSSDEVNVIMSDDARKTHFGEGSPETELGNKAAEGAGIGGAIGGTLGAIAAAAAAVGTTLLIPGLGLVIAGPLAAAIAGAGAGGVAGGLVGALIGWGIPEEHVKHYEEGLKSGGILLSVKPRNDQDASYFEQDWKSHHAEQVYH